MQTSCRFGKHLCKHSTKRYWTNSQCLFSSNICIDQQHAAVTCRNVQKHKKINFRKHAFFTNIQSTSSYSSMVYGWGSNISGALGEQAAQDCDNDNEQNSISSPKLVDIPQKTVCAAAGNNFSVIVAEDGHVYGCGINTHQQLGHHGANVEFVRKPCRIDDKLNGYVAGGGERGGVISVSCGRAHTWLVTSQQTVFSLGNNAQGQCGKSSCQDTALVEFDEQIIQVVCGFDHTLVLTDTGSVYSCGLGADGQTGLGHYGAVDKLTRVCGDIDQEKIISLASRGDCSLAVSDCGEVFGWGNSEYGQLAVSVGEEQQVNIPRHLPILAGNKVVQAATSGAMCGVITEEGDVYVWGYGILGLESHVQHLTKPELIPRTTFISNRDGERNPIRRIECGINHFAAISESRELFMWGKHRHHCLGSSSASDQYLPNKVNVENVIGVCCGYDHTLVLCH